MTQRRVFYSFHYKPDNWRVGQVRNIGAIEDNKPASDNDWETVKKGGDTAIQSWIDGQLKGRSCVVVLIGSETAGRKWINYEIEKGWNDGKGLVGIHIHQLKNREGVTATKGANPFKGFTLANGKDLSNVVKAYDPTGVDSKAVYQMIANNLDSWIEEAIRIRANN
ncbi:LysM repeat protein [Inhella inkyongensis]|uniref:LysM repeat protein n=1 Tax=Inhella inkyongensis TaxID=392593 RepID=A0A840S1D3_9BURK|nr:TIR domain-containing protein [Inhella inkyongensis]MBB5202886.1 LysM repeat protein [Inhella inkyongensis]